MEDQHHQGRDCPSSLFDMSRWGMDDSGSHPTCRVVVHEQRLHTIDALLNDFESKKLSKELDYSLLVSHYAVGFSLLIGEKEHVYPLLGSERMEDILFGHKNLPTVVIHAHAHNATKFHTELGPHTFFNVSFPATRSIRRFSLPLSKQLLLTEF